jgi:hypothetical protein
MARVARTAARPESCAAAALRESMLTNAAMRSSDKALSTHATTDASVNPML